MSLSEQESMQSEQNIENEQSIQNEHQEPEAVEEELAHGSSNDEASNEGDASAPHSEAKHGPHREQYDQFLKELEAKSDPESKLQFAIDFMESSLAHGSSPHFRNFWDARNISLALFKENIASPLRSILWAKYSDLSKEARRLKEILDEQSAFAVEQIEIAIKALEDDLTKLSEGTAPFHPMPLEAIAHAMQKHHAEYEKMQGELQFLNTQASRINAMRKELIRTEMRVRQKNKFFQRLSSAGDKVFPRRKELIKEVSGLFITDVDAFIASHFSQEHFKEPLFTLRDEIKALQNIAKALTLNTHAFTHTRMRLSECWDKLKVEDRERKKERLQKQEVFKENFDAAQQKIAAFRQQYEETQPQPAEATKQLDELVVEIRSQELGKSELYTLREQVQAIRKLIQEKVDAHEIVRQQHEQEKEQQRRQRIVDLKKDTETLLAEAAVLSAEQLEERRTHLLQTLEQTAMNKVERQEIERQLRPLRDLISEKREADLLVMSDDDRQSLQQLKEILKQRKERRQEIKMQMDQLRKAAGSSGFDFEQAMNFKAQVEVERERLEKINQGIDEIETKIAQLSKRS